MTVWDDVVGQPELVTTLRRAVADADALVQGKAGPSMTHAWLFTGPPGSGRSTAALAFAAALQCPEQGCGTCDSCRQVAAGGHPDVERFVPEATQIRVPEVQELLRRAVLAPVHGRWNVVVMEDADRLNDVAGNALLKAVEEPNPHAVWVLCAPAVDDVLPTIASRTRNLRLRTPSLSEVAHALTQKHGVDPAVASFAARVAQGHIGRARALATHESVRARRHEVMGIPTSLRGIGGCFTAAANLLSAATADAGAICDELDAEQAAAVASAFGDPQSGAGGARVRRAAAGAQKELLGRQKARRTRMVRDQLDRALIDLMSFYRDVLVLQVGAEVPLINEELRPTVSAVAGRAAPPTTYRQLAAIEDARLALAASVAPQLALEAMTVKLAGLG